jgi:hypothetical protein
MIKFSWVTKACDVFLLWAAMAVALPAQTFTSLFSFDYEGGAGPRGDWSRAPMGTFTEPRMLAGPTTTAPSLKSRQKGR